MNMPTVDQDRLSIQWDKAIDSIGFIIKEQQNFSYAVGFNAGLDERDKLAAINAELVEICTDFVRRVDSGEVRSKSTYEKMKKALSKAN